MVLVRKHKKKHQFQGIYDSQTFLLLEYNTLYVPILIQDTKFRSDVTYQKKLSQAVSVITRDTSVSNLIATHKIAFFSSQLYLASATKWTHLGSCKGLFYGMYNKDYFIFKGIRLCVTRDSSFYKQHDIYVRFTIRVTAHSYFTFYIAILERGMARVFYFCSVKSHKDTLCIPYCLRFLFYYISDIFLK